MYASFSGVTILSCFISYDSISKAQACPTLSGATPYQGRRGLLNCARPWFQGLEVGSCARPGEGARWQENHCFGRRGSGGSREDWPTCGCWRQEGWVPSVPNALVAVGSLWGGNAEETGSGFSVQEAFPAGYWLCLLHNMRP